MPMKVFRKDASIGKLWLLLILVKEVSISSTMCPSPHSSHLATSKDKIHIKI